MPRFQITAPDGRIITVEGDTAPTETDAAGIFASLPAKKSEDKTGPRSKSGLQAPKGSPDTGLRDLPLMVQDIATEAIPATAGMLIGGPLLGAILGGLGNTAVQARRMAAHEQEGFKPGQLAASTLASAIPGSSATTAGAKVLAKEAGKQALGGLAGKTIETAIDEGRLPTGGEAALSTLIPAAGGALSQRLGSKGADVLNKTKRETLEAGKDLGLVVVPSSVNDSFINKRLEGLVGVPRMKQAASLKNQPATTLAVKEELGIRPETDITEQLLQDIRKQEAAPYAEISAMAEKAKSELADIRKQTSSSSAHETAAAEAIPDTAKKIKVATIQAGADIDGLRDARLAAKEGYYEYRRTGDRKALESARQSEQLAAELEKSIEEAAKQFGSNDLLGRLKASRERIAKTWDVENALNTADAEVSSEILARLSKKGRPLSGNLETIAEFRKAFPHVMTEGSKVPPLSGTAAETGYALASLATGHPLLAASMLARAPTRALLLSSPYQALLTSRPFAMPNAAAGTRALAQEAGQEVTRDPKRTTP